MNDAQLSAEQTAIAMLPFDSHTMVSAGPGTGKTHVLVSRVSELLKQGLVAADILILSFSRAAVGEVEARLKAVQSDAAYVRVRTLDSTALALLLRRPPGSSSSDQPEDVRPHDLSFNNRILEATGFLLEDAEVAARYVRFKHIIIDEVQDIVGWRAEFALSLLMANLSGFTLLGDSAQGIYEFSLSPEERLANIGTLSKLVSKQFALSMKRFTLTKNFRNPLTNSRLAALGLALAESEPDFEVLCDQLKESIGKLLSVPSLRSLSRMFQNAGRHAVLCSTNGDALCISRELHRLGVVHTLRGDGPEGTFPSSLLKVLHSIPTDSVTKEQFLTSFPIAMADLWLPPDLAWDELRRIAGSHGRYLVVKDIVSGMRLGWVKRNQPRSNAKVVVSTVHRAKGLEFDTVYLYRVPFGFGGAAESARMAYVALSRSKGKTYNIQHQNWPFMTKTLDKRWRVPYSHNNLATRELELLPTDSADDLFPPGYLLGLARETQLYIETNVHPNDQVQLRRISHVLPESRYDYEILHSDRVVGLTSGLGIDSGLQRFPAAVKMYEMPDGISGLFVDSIETVAGLAGAAKQCGLGVLDVWLRVVIVGIGTLQWPRQRRDR